MKVKVISIIAVIFAGILVTFLLISSSMSKSREYYAYLNSARNNAQRGIPYTAVQNYKQALSMKCESEEIYQEYLEQAQLVGDDFYIEALNSYVENFPTSPSANELLCSYYYEHENYKKVIELSLAAREAGAATELIKQYYLECSVMFKNLKSGYEDANSFVGSYAVVKQDGLYGVLSYTGQLLLKPSYSAIQPFINQTTAAFVDDEWVMINQQGYVVAKPDKEIDSMSFISGGKILVSKDGKFNYMDTALMVPNEFSYDNATNFKNGIAAVQKKGKWALMNSNMELITDYSFDDVIIDECNTCIGNGVIFLKTNGKYAMYDANGNRIGEQSFDDAKPFVGVEDAAICINGKWGFVNAQGQITIEPQYEEADSFNIGLAPVCINGKWGYIDSTTELRIDAQFNHCKSFSDAGIAVIQDESDLWGYIKLISYDN